jgi:hypothetical protein
VEGQPVVNLVIPWYLIVTSGLVTAAAVAVATLAAGWRDLDFWSSAPVAGVLIIGWRAFANLMQINGDLIPDVSPGDVGCLAAGAIAPLAVAVRNKALPYRWLPAIAGGLAGFLVNVAIL